jgi:predicted nuclease with TOPRIM domain
MNNARREALEELQGKLSELKDELECIACEERDYYENMTESLQCSERGEKADECASNLEDGVDSLDTIINNIDGVIS